MKNKKIVLILSGILILSSLTACSSTAQPQVSNTTNAVGGPAITVGGNSIELPNPEEETEIKYDKEVKEESNKNNDTNKLSEKEKNKMIKNDKEYIDKMIPLLDATLMCMQENDYKYDTSNSEFIWSELFYYVGNYNHNYEDMMIEDGSCKVSEDLLINIAKSLGIEKLPKLDKNISFVTKTNEDYLFMLGDRGCSQSELVSFSKNKDDSFDVEIRLFNTDDKTTISTGVFHLVKIDNGDLPFAITKVNISRNINDIDILSGKVGEFEDSHTISMIIKNETKFYQVTNEEVIKKLESKSTGAFVDFVVQNDTIVDILN